MLIILYQLHKVRVRKADAFGASVVNSFQNQIENLC